MSSLQFTLTGDVAVNVTVTEVNGTLVFDVAVVQPGEDGYTGQIGEINGLFFDMLGDVNVDYGVITAAEGADALETQVDENDVSNLGGGVNLNGTVVKTYGEYDVGVLLDETGLGNGDLQAITFTLSADEPLTLDDVALMDFGVRLTSVGDPDGARNGSSKIGGTAPEAPEDPVLVNTAFNDSLTVTESEMFDGPDGFDFLDGGATTILANDETSDGTTTSAYAGVVTGAGGTALSGAPVTVTNVDGTELIIYEDGRVDFSANGVYDYLQSGQQAQTVFEYEIEGGSTAEIFVTILGQSDPGGPGGPGGPDLG